MNSCQLCPQNIPREQIILENQFCIFTRREETILIGSGLIIPRTHRSTAFDLSTIEWAATQEILLEAKASLDKEFHPDGYNIGWNCGSIAGQEIFHAHLHLIPRFKDEPLAGKGIRYWLKQEINKR